jgi:hypothetical protein
MIDYDRRRAVGELDVPGFVVATRVGVCDNQRKIIDQAIDLGPG